MQLASSREGAQEIEEGTWQVLACCVSPGKRICSSGPTSCSEVAISLPTVFIQTIESRLLTKADDRSQSCMPRKFDVVRANMSHVKSSEKVVFQGPRQSESKNYCGFWP